MAHSQADKPDQAVLDEIRKRLIETGDWDRLSTLLRSRLEESGWDDDLKDYAKERARAQENLNLESLLKEVTPKAHEMLQPKLREAVVQEIEAVLEREVEKA
ncbi:SAGA histone acetylase and TREX-2 complexes component [Saitozyma podzolica]|uniref:Transcription and mRNA export factor SUS1 n=1 Tax=Saitozyma podzolica TaxID=1890683 RepID=A0A427YGP9_9TREE|nr:SAGA histone acetylase and TREX-2 complexes component [Saitozyma podzolica]